MSQHRTLDWLISTLKWYEELRATNASYGHPTTGGVIAVNVGSAEAAAQTDNYRDLMRVGGEIEKAAGRGRIQLLCDELENSDGLTTANVVKLRAKVCRAKPCKLEAANALVLDEVADILEGTIVSESNGDQPQSPLSDLAGKIVVVATAGDLRKAYSEGKRPFFQCSGMSIRPGKNTPTTAATDDATEAKRMALDRAQALVTAEGGDKAAAMERLIARVQLQAEMDKASVINMPLAKLWGSAAGDLFGLAPGRWRCMKCDPPTAALRLADVAERIRRRANRRTFTRHNG